MYKELLQYSKLLEKELKHLKPNFWRKISLVMRLYFCYISLAILHDYYIIFCSPTSSFLVLHAPKDNGTWKSSYYYHLLYKRNVRLVSATLAIIFLILGLSLFFLSSIFFLPAEVRIAHAKDGVYQLNSQQKNLQINETERYFQEIAKQAQNNLNYPKLEQQATVDLSPESQSLLKEALISALANTEVHFYVDEDLQTPTYNNEGIEIYNYYQSLSLTNAFQEILGRVRNHLNNTNKAVFSGDVPLSDELKNANVRGWAIITVYSDPVVKIVETDANGHWQAALPINSLANGKHTVYLQTEVNGVQTEQIDIADFVVQENKHFSDTTVFFIVNIILIILLFLLIILMQLRKNEAVVSKLG